MKPGDQDLNYHPNKRRILHECSCFIECIKEVEEKEIKCEACQTVPYRLYKKITLTLCILF